MVSNNGKIPAGSVTLKVTENGHLCEYKTGSTENFKIDKCPDKYATVDL